MGTMEEVSGILLIKHKCSSTCHLSLSSSRTKTWPLPTSKLHSYDYTTLFQEKLKITDLHFIRVLGNSVCTWFSSKQGAGRQCHGMKPVPKKMACSVGFRLRSHRVALGIHGRHPEVSQKSKPGAYLNPRAQNRAILP